MSRNDEAPLRIIRSDVKPPIGSGVCVRARADDVRATAYITITWLYYLPGKTGDLHSLTPGPQKTHRGAISGRLGDRIPILRQIISSGSALLRAHEHAYSHRRIRSSENTAADCSSIIQIKMSTPIAICRRANPTRPQLVRPTSLHPDFVARNSPEDGWIGLSQGISMRKCSKSIDHRNRVRFTGLRRDRHSHNEPGPR